MIAVSALPVCDKSDAAIACLASSRDGKYKVGSAGGQVWLLETLDGVNGKKFRRSLLGDFNLVSANPTTVRISETSNGQVFVFAGVFRGASKIFRIWYLGGCSEDVSLNSMAGESGCHPVEIQRNCNADAKLKGFGDVTAIESTSKECIFRIVCGLGISRIHIWKLVIDIEELSFNLDYEGMATTNSSLSNTALLFGKDGASVLSVSTIDEAVKCWDFGSNSLREANQESGKTFSVGQRFSKTMTAESLSALADVGDVFSAEDIVLLSKLNAGFQMPQNRALGFFFQVEENLKEWGLLFPMEENKNPDTGSKRMLSPTSSRTADFELSEFCYEGELDCRGRPHGHGSQCFLDGVALEYEGQWIHGKREGVGSLRNLNSGQLVYEGEWADDAPHGNGHELISGKEEYYGFFEKGLRHGFGVLDILAASQFSIEKSDANGKSRNGKRQRFAGESYVGFWKMGQPHGIGRWIFPVGCAGLNHKNPNILIHMGKIGCLVWHTDGVILREFFYHREDGVAISEKEQKLVQLGACHQRNNDLANSFAFSRSASAFWADCDLCWRCLKKSKPLFVCCRCSLVCHKTCIPGSRCPRPSCSENASNLVELESLPRKRGETVDCADIDGILSAKQSSKAQAPRAALTNVSAQVRTTKRAQNQTTRLDEDVRRAEEAAKKLGSEARKKRRRNLLFLLDEKLSIHRRRELADRKSWRMELENLELQVSVEGNELLQLQTKQNSLRLELNRLQGRDLNSLHAPELAELQASLESMIGACIDKLEDFVTT